MRRLILLLPLLLLACGKPQAPAWLGYAEGDNAFVSAPQAGWVVRLGVQRGDAVRRGQRLFALDDTRETASRDEAVANIAQTEAELTQARASLDYALKDLARQAALVKAHAGTQATLDLSRSTWQQQRAHITQLQGQEKQQNAALADASYQLTQRDVVSRVAGRVQDIYFRTGEYAPAMTPVVSVLPPANVYVRFFVPESDFARLKLGQKVAIGCDGCAPGLQAIVTFIAQQEEFTPPVIFSIASRSKLVFKVEARAPGGLRLNPGQPVDVRPL